MRSGEFHPGIRSAVAVSDRSYLISLCGVMTSLMRTREDVLSAPPFEYVEKRGPVAIPRAETL